MGETLVDETREYGPWADWLGVPRHTFSAVFGAVIAQGMDYRDAFQFFDPGFRLDAERARRADSWQPETFGEGDLYPDARPAMEVLRAMGIWVGIAGNQTSRAGDILPKLDLPADMIATSDDWNASKPDASNLQVRPVWVRTAAIGRRPNQCRACALGMHVERSVAYPGSG